MKRSAMLTMMMLISGSGVWAAEAAPTHPHGCSALAGTVSRNLMQKPIALTEAPGKLHQQVTTADEEAQAYYDQGIAYLASYVWVEAARSFHEAVRRDPDLAMAYLGLSKAYAGAEAPADSLKYLQQAEQLAGRPGVSLKEVKWIALGVQQHDALAASADRRSTLHATYKNAIEDLVKLDSADPLAWILRGNAEEAGAWGRGQFGSVGSIAYYEAALQRDPDNLAAHHFLVHSFENIGRHDLAVEHGERYAALAAAIPHAHHMVGHVLPRLGRWKEALDQFAEADRLEREHYAAEGTAPDDDWHHSHNLQLLGTINLRLGHDEEAERFFTEAFRLEARGPRAGRAGTSLVEFLILRGRFQEAVTAARQLAAGPTATSRLFGSALEAEALLGLGRPDQAVKARNRAVKAYKQALDDAKGTPYETFTPGFIGPFIRTIDGEMDLHSKNPEQGEEQLLQMADEIASNPRFDAWGEGLFRLERIAQEARRAGRVGLASELAERMKKIDPDFRSEAAVAVAGGAE